MADNSPLVRLALLLVACALGVVGFVLLAMLAFGLLFAVIGPPMEQIHKPTGGWWPSVVFGAGYLAGGTLCLWAARRLNRMRNVSSKPQEGT